MSKPQNFKKIQSDIKYNMVAEMYDLEEVT